MDTSNPPNDQHSFFIMEIKDNQLQEVQGHPPRGPAKKDPIPRKHMHNTFDQPKPARSSRRQRQRSKSDISAFPYDPSSSRRWTRQAPLVRRSDQRWPSSPGNTSDFQGQGHTGPPPPSYPNLNTPAQTGFVSPVQNDGHNYSLFDDPSFLASLPEVTSETGQVIRPTHTAGGRPLLSLNTSRTQENNHEYISNATVQPGGGVSMARNDPLSPMNATPISASLSSSLSSVSPCDLHEPLVVAFQGTCGHTLYFNTSTLLISHNPLNVRVLDYYSTGAASSSSSVQPILSATSAGDTYLPAVTLGIVVSGGVARPFQMNQSDDNFSFSPVEINSNCQGQKVPIEWSENPNQMPGPLWIKTSTAPENDPAIYSAMHYTSPDGSFPPVSFMT